MKSIFLLAVLMSSTFLAAQINKHNNPYKVIHEDENGIYLQSQQIHNHYPPTNLKDKDGWDTLYISTDLPDPSINVIGPFYNYIEWDFTWLSDTLCYIELNNEHQFQIGVRMKVYPDVFWVFEENYTIGGTDTLHFSISDAIYELEIHPVDQNGTDFEQLDGVENSDIHVLVPQGIGYYAWQGLHYLEGTSYFSQLSNEYYIQCSSIFYDVEIEKTTCFIEFPAINGLDQNHLLENQPLDYLHTNLQVYITNKPVDYMGVGFLMGIVYLNYKGKFNGYGAGSAQSFDPFDFWNGELFLISEDNNLFKSTVELVSLSNKGSQPYTMSYTPYFETINDSIGCYYGMYSYFNMYKVGVDDTLFFGETPTTMWQSWHNNNPNGDIFANGGNYGMMREYIMPINDLSNYTIKDENGNIIFEDEGSEVIVLNNAEPGIYTIEISNFSSPLINGFGSSKLNVKFSFGSEDATPPTISPIQFRDTQGKPTYKIETGEILELLFSADDFNDEYDTTGSSFFVFQPVIDDSTRVYIKEYGSENWLEIVIEKYHEDTTSGYFYRADLSSYTNLDSSALDLKIKIWDFNNNYAEYIISPAILIDGFLITDIGDEKTVQSTDFDFHLFPNPASSLVNIKMTYPTETEVKISIFDIFGTLLKTIPEQKINKGEHSLILNLKNKNGLNLQSGIYYISIGTNNQTNTKKLIVH